MRESEFTDPVLHFSVSVPAPVEDVWDAWTTQEGIESFFAPECSVELEVYGDYEMYFNPDQPDGERGGEGNKILSFEKPEFLAFTWNAPLKFSEIRRQRTVVYVRLQEEEEESTRVELTHIGWPSGDIWKECRKYFDEAWGDVVLPHLKRRFEEGPIDWGKR